MMDSLVDNAIEDEDTQESEREDSVEVTNEDSNTETKGMSDEEIAGIAQSLSTNISVIGCGGGGCNTVQRTSEEGISGAELVAVNTDAQDLQGLDVDTKLLIGRETCQGRGAGSRPKLGAESAREDLEEIERIVEDQNMVFVTAGMGGGTGTGAAPVVAEVASEHALTISVVTTPFDAEGTRRKQNAQGGLKRLKEHSDTVIVVPNDRLLEFAPNLPLRKAFKIADEVLMRSVKGITELITNPSLVNLDFADIKTVMSGGGVAMIGLGDGEGTNKSEESVREALESPLLDVNIANSSRVLVNVVGGPNMQMEEAEGVVDLLNDRVSDTARIIWGTGVSQELQGEIRTMVVITGVESPQIYGEESEVDFTTEDEEDDIDYVR